MILLILTKSHKRCIDILDHLGGISVMVDKNVLPTSAKCEIVIETIP